MKKVSKNLFIIFGTTSGIGKELYKYTSTFSEIRIKKLTDLKKIIK